MEKWKNRVAEYPCDKEFISRVSTRAFDENKQIEHDTLMSCFEAARWAPSSYNNQPWRYCFAKKGSKTYQTIYNTLVEFNQMWCKNVQVLIVICSRKHFSHNNQIAATSSLDTGSSYMSFSLEAHKRGLATHAMEGFNKDKLRNVMNIPDMYNIEAILAVGYPGDISILPKEVQDKETPTARKALKEIVSEDHFIFT
jgi:nitroreductase